MNDMMFEELLREVRLHLESLNRGITSLGPCQDEIAGLSGECQNVLDTLANGDANAGLSIVSRLKRMVERIDQTISIFTEERSHLHRKMRSIGNRKKIQKAYE